MPPGPPAASAAPAQAEGSLRVRTVRSSPGVLESIVGGILGFLFGG